MTDLIVTAIAVFFIGMYVGWKLNDMLFKHIFGKMLKDAGVDNKTLEQFVRHWAPIVEKETGIKAEAETPEVFIKIEEHHGSLYAFRKDNDAFLGQGATREELIERLRYEFEGEVTVKVTEEDGAHLFKAS